MAEIHHLIRSRGRDAARVALAKDPQGRLMVDIAHTMMADEQSALGFTHSGFAITALPHHDPGPDVIYNHRVGNFRLTIEPGATHTPDFSGVRRVGVPYGTRARLILMYLQSSAVRRSNPEVELGTSMRTWMTSMGLPGAGSDYEAVRTQAERISLCKLTLAWRDGDNHGLSQEMIVSEAINLNRLKGGRKDDERQTGLWTPKVRLTDGFYQQLLKHPVPYHERAVKSLIRHRLALDVYIWLCYRTHKLDRDQRISWAALHAQFGASYKTVAGFKPRFTAALKLALAAREEAEAELDMKNGLLLLAPKSNLIGYSGRSNIISL